MALNFEQGLHVVQNEVEKNVLEGAEVDLVHLLCDKSVVLGILVQFFELRHGNLSLGALHVRVKRSEVFIQLVNVFAKSEREAASQCGREQFAWPRNSLYRPRYQSIQVLRDADCKEAFRVKFDTVHVDKEGVISLRLNFDAVQDKVSLARAIGSMHVDIATTGKKGSKLENFRFYDKVSNISRC